MTTALVVIAIVTVIFNTMAAGMLHDVIRKEFKWWRVWLGIIFLIPPIGLVTAIAAFVLCLIFVLVVSLIESCWDNGDKFFQNTGKKVK